MYILGYVVQETQERQVRSLGQEDPLEEERATHSSILAWKTPRTEEPGGLQSIALQRVRHDWAYTANEYTFNYMWGFSVEATARGLKAMHVLLTEGPVLPAPLAIPFILPPTGHPPPTRPRHSGLMLWTTTKLWSWKSLPARNFLFHVLIQQRNETVSLLKIYTVMSETSSTKYNIWSLSRTLFWILIWTSWLLKIHETIKKLRTLNIRWC